MTITTKTLFAAGIVSLLAFTMPGMASADARSRSRDLAKKAAKAEQGRVAELHRDRAELRRDYEELERDRADLRRLQRSGASRQEIIRKRQEINGDLREISQDRREIREDLEALRGRQGYDNGWGNDDWRRDRWGRNDNSGGGSSRDRWDNRGNRGNWDRFGWGYGRD